MLPGAGARSWGRRRVARSTPAYGLIAALHLAGCAKATFARDGLPCDAGECLSGYVCNVNDICVIYCDDTDADGVCDRDDVCAGGSDGDDADGDLVPDGCDPCPLDAPDDTDGDLVCDRDDRCPGGVDSSDIDSDGVPDACDACAGVDDAYAVAPACCDSSVPTCTTACLDNSDGAAEVVALVDCVEAYCGTDPADAASVCRTIGSASQLDAALSSGDAEHLLLKSGELEVSAVRISEAGTSLAGRVGSVLQADGAGPGLEVAAANVTLRGLTLRAPTLATALQISGNAALLRDLVVDGYGSRGIRVTGDNATLASVTVIGGSGGSVDGNAGIVLDGAQNTLVVASIIAQNLNDAVQLDNADGTRLDHNTIADNDGDGIAFSGSGSRDVCVRNNLLAANSGAALSMQGGGHDFDTSTACTAPLAAGPSYGNDDFGNGNTCGGSSCGGCNCLPNGSFFPYAIDPGFTQPPQELGTTPFYCLGVAELIDVAAPLGHDLNGAEPADFQGSAPDVGAREAGSSTCPP